MLLTVSSRPILIFSPPQGASYSFFPLFRNSSVKKLDGVIFP